MLQTRKIASVEAQLYKLPDHDPLDNWIDYTLFIIALLAIPCAGIAVVLFGP